MQIDIHAVCGCRHVSPHSRPLLRPDRFGVHLGPLPPAVECPIRAEQYHHIARRGSRGLTPRSLRVRRTRCRPRAWPRIPRPPRPCHCWRRLVAFLVRDPPRPAGIVRAGDAVVETCRTTSSSALRIRDTRPCRGLPKRTRRGSGPVRLTRRRRSGRRGRATPRAMCRHHLERRKLRRA